MLLLLSKAWRQFSSCLAASSGAVARAAYSQHHDSVGKFSTRHISTAKLISPLQSSLVSKSPRTYPSARSFSTASQSRKQNSRVANEVEEEEEDDGDDADASETEGNDDDEDDAYDDNDAEDEDEEEEEETSSQVPLKKKFQINQLKAKAPEPQGRLRNEKITAQTVRLVMDGEGHWIISRAEALALARKKNLDLVQVDGGARPPVCKIFDFNKEEYRHDQIQKDRKKKKGDMVHLNEVKELRFSPKTESKDLKMKANRAREFMDRGHRVKLVVNFKGIKGRTEEEEQQNRIEQGKLIDAIIPMVEDIAGIEQGPRIESTKAWVMLRPLKFGGQVKKKQPKSDAQPNATSQVKTLKHEDDFTEVGDSEVQEVLAKMEGFEGSSSQVGGSQMQSSTLWSPHAGGRTLSPQKPRMSSPMQAQPPHLSSRPPFVQGSLDFQGVARPRPPLPPSPSGPWPSASSALQGTGVGYSEVAGSPPSSDLFNILTSQEELKPPSPAFSERPPALRGIADMKASATAGLSQRGAIEGGKKQGPEVQPPPSLQEIRGIQGCERGDIPKKHPHSTESLGVDVAQTLYPPPPLGRGSSQASASFTPPKPHSTLRGPPNFPGPDLSTLAPVPGHGKVPHSSRSPPMPSSQPHNLSNDQSPLLDFFTSTSPSMSLPQQRGPSNWKGPRPPLSPVQNVQARYPPSMAGYEGSSSDQSPPMRSQQGGPSSAKGACPRVSPAQDAREGSYPPGHEGSSNNESPLLDLFPSTSYSQPRGLSSAKGVHPPISPAQNAHGDNSPSPAGREGSSNDQSPLLDLFPSPSPPQPRGPPSAKGVRPPISPAQNAHGGYSTALPGHEGPSRDASPLLDLFSSTTPPQPRGPSNAQGIRPLISPGQNAQGRYPPPAGYQAWQPRGPPRYTPPPVSQPRYPPPLGEQNPHEPLSWGTLPTQEQGFMQGPYGHSPNQSQFAPRPDLQFSLDASSNSGLEQRQGQHVQPPPVFGSQSHTHPRQSGPSQVQFGYQRAPGPVGPHERSPWLPQQGPPRGSRPMPPPNQQQAGHPPIHNNEGHFVQQEAFGFAGDQNQAPQGYSPQGALPHTQPSRYPHAFQGDGQSRPQCPAQLRGFPQTRPPPGYQPSGSPRPQSQPRYPPLFGSTSEDS